MIRIWAGLVFFFGGDSESLLPADLSAFRAAFSAAVLGFFCRCKINFKRIPAVRDSEMYFAFGHQVRSFFPSSGARGPKER